MRMSSVGRVAFPVLVVVGMVLAAVPQSAAAQASIVSPPERADRVIRAKDVLADAWDLLLNYYMEPLEPAALAEAADAGMRIALRENGVTPLPEPLAVPGDRAGAWSALVERYETLLARYAEVAPNDLTEQAILAMAATAHDPHTKYFTADDLKRLQQAVGDESYPGIGARARGPQATITEVYAGTPAAAVGLQPGDRIVRVADRQPPDLATDRSVELPCGEVGALAELTIEKARTGEQVEVSMTCEAILIPLVESRIVDGVGYIRLRSFMSYGVVQEVEDAVRTMQDAGVRGIVLDLRGNGGGYIEAGVRILRRLVPNGSVYRVAERDGEPIVRDICAPSPTSRTGAAILSGRQLGGGLDIPDDNSCSGEPVLAVPLAVLVDEQSASTSEFFASTVEESQAGRVFGGTTRGGLAASLIVPLADGSALQLGYAQILTGEGRRINRVGVRPDEVVEFQIEALWSGTDTQLARAVAYLRDGGTRPARIMRLRSQ
jgi:carboxyl-terminal processing protease